MKQFLLITIMAIFNSCDKNIQESPCCINIDVTFSLRIKNMAGEDLLNPSTTGYYNHSNINHYLITDGVKKILTTGNSLISNPEPNAGILDYRIFVVELGEKIEETPYPVYKSFLELNSNTIDTIKVETLEENNNQSLRKIWYNGKLIWEVGGNNNLPLTIIK